jgi:hypothetical protein
MIKKLRHRSTMRKCLWKEVREEVSQKNPELAKIIDDLNPSSKYPLYELTFPFGAEILKNGILQLPTMSDDDKVDTAPFNDSRYFSNELQEQLGYNSGSNPVALILNGTAELFFEVQNRVIPFTYGLTFPGKFFGLSRLVMNHNGFSHSSAFLWWMTAGARSMGMLAKASHGKSHNKLVKIHDISPDMPQGFWDDYYVLRQLYQSKNFGESWELKLIFFSKEWFGEQFWSDPAWLAFRCYGLDTVCRLNDFQINRIIYDLIFSTLQERGKFALNPFAIETAENLLYMAMGAVPGFAPVINNDPGPVERFQEIYNNDYGLGYAPIMMAPHTFSISNPQSVYASLAYPTALEFARKLRVLSSKVSDLSQIDYYLRKYEHEIQQGYLNITDIPLHNLFNKVDFRCYHTHNEGHSNIKHPHEIPMNDPYFLSPKYCQEKEFPALNVFTRGCIQISHKDKSKK